MTKVSVIISGNFTSRGEICTQIETDRHAYNTEYSDLPGRVRSLGWMFIFFTEILSP